MRIQVIASGARIAPFGDLARDLPVAGVPLQRWQDELFRRFGLERIDVASRAEVDTSGGPSLLTWDNVFLSRRVLKSFLERWSGKEPVRLALPAGSTLIRRFSALQDTQGRDASGRLALLDLYGLPAGAGPEASAAPLEVVYKERVLELDVPRRTSGIERWDHPLTSSVCLTVGHWLHLLQANLLAIQVRWIDRVITQPLWAASVLLRALLPIPGRGGLSARLARAANQIGRGARIHPSALVEGSILGEGVKIGPGAIVRGSILGPGVVIEPGADVAFSVLGEKAYVSKHSIVYAVAALEEAELCMKGMQMCVVGRRAVLTARATALDVFPGHPIRVEDQGRFREVDLPVLGACFGHDTFVGADVYVGPGRAIPNGVRIVPAPDRVLSRIPAELEAGRAYAVRNGTLEPL
jgi:hypothetical protein